MSNYTTNTAISLLDGVNLTTYGTFIERMIGFLDVPGRKEPYKFSWPDEHGLDIDLSAVYYDERKCQLDLIVTGESYQDLVYKVGILKTALKGTGYRYLKLYKIAGVFLVYPSGPMVVARLNRGITNAQSARITVPMIEPYPEKLFYYTDGDGAVSLDITTTETITIDWGDNQYTVLTESGEATHNYASPGDYCIIIYGGIEGITNITPDNCVELTQPSGGGEEEPEPSPLTVDDTSVTVDSTNITADNT